MLAMRWGGSKLISNVFEKKVGVWFNVNKIFKQENTLSSQESKGWNTWSNKVPKSLKMLLGAVATIGMKPNQHPLNIWEEKRDNKLSHLLDH
jgi:hypothetical protein